jgi:hypothetical protein
LCKDLNKFNLEVFEGISDVDKHPGLIKELDNQYEPEGVSEEHW